ncbi:MAG TPA: PucC family protein [Gemmatimonadaceae bacterium]|nr:PucC family protein [Gemmatimonadaceae bacterium]
MLNRVSARLLTSWASKGPRLLPFADVATADLPLSRLLRLSLFQVSVGMASVLLIGTLNRVMIVELGVPASLVAVMISLPLLAAPFRALIGFRSDTHVSALGWRRVPFIWKGTMLQFGGLAIMPFAMIVVAPGGNNVGWPDWIGQVCAGLAFLLVGAGLHMVQTVGLALATDLVAEESQPRVVGLMYVMLLVGMIASAVIFGALLENFSRGRLIQVIQGAAVVTIALNILAMWKQEARDPHRTRADRTEPTFSESWQTFIAGDGAIRRLIAVGMGTMAFTMQDVLLEPYGGQVLGLTVASTTRLTATLAMGGLIGFLLASRVLGRGGDPFRMSSYGALIGIPGFAAVILAAPTHSVVMFFIGTFLIGFGGGLLSHGTLTATMNHAPEKQRGLALGAWGAVQASAAGIAVAFGGITRDVVNGMQGQELFGVSLSGAAAGYSLVYSLEIVLLAVTLVSMLPLVRRTPARVAA